MTENRVISEAGPSLRFRVLGAIQYFRPASTNPHYFTVRRQIALGNAPKGRQMSSGHSQIRVSRNDRCEYALRLTKGSVNPC